VRISLLTWKEYAYLEVDTGMKKDLERGNDSVSWKGGQKSVVMSFGRRMRRSDVMMLENGSVV
jgi:hypothetical protein